MNNFNSHVMGCWLTEGIFHRHCVYFVNALHSSRRSWRQLDRWSTCRRLHSASPQCESFVLEESWKPYHSEDIWNKKSHDHAFLTWVCYFKVFLLRLLTCTKPCERSADSFPWHASVCLQNDTRRRIPDSSTGTCDCGCVRELWNCTCWVTALSTCRTSGLRRNKKQNKTKTYI